MNKIIILVGMVIIAFSMIFTSCEAPEGNTYQIDGTKLSFQTARFDMNLVDSDGTSIKVPINRSNTTGAYDVPVTLKTTSQTLFTLASSTVSFKDGEGVAYAEINHPVASQLNPAATYNLVVKYDKALNSPSGLDSTIVNVKRKVTWQSIGTGTYTSAFFEDSWAQPIEQALEDPTLYRMPNCLTNNYPILFVINSTTNAVTFNTQQTGYTEGSYGLVSIAMPAVASPNQPKKTGKQVDLWCRFVVSAGSFGEFHEVLMMP